MRRVMTILLLSLSLLAVPYETTVADENGTNLVMHYIVGTTEADIRPTYGPMGLPPDSSIIVERVKLMANDGGLSDYFGNAVAVSDDIIVIGASFHDVDAISDAGSAYIFERNRGGRDNWGLVKRLSASDGGPFDNFGVSVTVFGDTIVIGASGDDIGGNTDQGSAYIFSRNVGGANDWGLVKKLLGSDCDTYDDFGESVSISGDTIVVGASHNDIGTTYAQGSAYVFERNTGGADNWGQVKQLIAGDGAYGDQFGVSVSISGDTIVVGAHMDDIDFNDGQGSAYVFERNMGGADDWGQVKKLVSDDGTGDDHFGSSVSVSGGTTVIGAYGNSVGKNYEQGSAYVFERNSGGSDEWGQVTKLTAVDGAEGDLFGDSVSISGDSITVGAPWDDIGEKIDQGSVYFFKRNVGGPDNWSQEEQLTSNDGMGDDHFGDVVSIYGNCMVIGAAWDDIRENYDQGSSYLFLRIVNAWTEECHPIASDGGDSDFFGSSVSVSGDTAVVGAVWDDVGDNNGQGSVYVLSRNKGGADNWGEVAKVTSSDGSEYDHFGQSVSILGDTIVVGAQDHAIGGNTSQGSAYVFTRNAGGADNWGQVAQPLALDGAKEDLFGCSVSISGDTIVVGAYMDDIGFNDNQGSAYVFERNRGGADNWGLVRKLTASDGAPLAYFGTSVSISGDTIVIGATQDNVWSTLYQGSAYVFERNAGGADNWGQVAQLTSNDGAELDHFGHSVSISGDTIVAGTIDDDVGGNVDQGSVYVFERNRGGTDDWGQVTQLLGNDSSAQDHFGCSLSISDDVIVVGADWNDIGANGRQGSAYVFERNAGGAENWGQTSRLLASDGDVSDWYGCSTSVSGDTIISGAIHDDVGPNTAQGSAYIHYHRYLNDPPDITTPDDTIAREDEEYRVNYDADDPDVWDKLTWDLASERAWLSINSTSGVLSGTPENCDVGDQWVNVSVDDGRGGSDWTNFTLDVVDTNDIPTIVTPDDRSAVEDEYYIVDYNASDPDEDSSLKWALSTNVKWLSMNVNSGTLSGIPRNDEVGYYSVNVSVDDGRGGRDWSNFTLSVNNSDPIILTSNDVVAEEDALYYANYNCDDDGCGAIQWSLGTNADWLNMDEGTGIITGTPDNRLVGAFWLNVSVHDGNGGMDWTNFTLTVLNDPPDILTKDDFKVYENVLYCVDYECSDDGQGTITWSLVTDAAWLSMDAVTGTLYGTPDDDDVGSWKVNVIVDDGNGGTDRNEFTLNALNVNDPPQITTEAGTNAEEGTQYIVDYEAYDPDPWDVLKWSLETNVDWLNMDKSSGVLKGTPDEYDIGTFWVRVSVEDHVGSVDWTEFNLTVVNVNDIPTITTTDDTDALEGALYVVDYNATDPDLSDLLIWGLDTNATWLSIDVNTGVLSGTPDKGDIGVYRLDVFVQDGNGGEDHNVFDLTVLSGTDDDDDVDPGNFLLMTLLCSFTIIVILIISTIIGSALLFRDRKKEMIAPGLVKPLNEDELHRPEKGVQGQIAPIEGAVVYGRDIKGTDRSDGPSSDLP